MPEIELDQNSGSGGQQDPEPNVVNDPNADPNNVDGAADGSGDGDPGEAGKKGNDPISFMDGIPEADREGFGDFQGKTVGEFVKHYKSLQDGKITIPDTYEPIENIEVKNQGNYDALSKFCKEDLGLTQDQFSKLLPAMVTRDQTVLNEFQKSVTDMNEAELDKVLTEEAEAAKATLMQEWGGTCEARTAAATGLVKALSDDDFVDYLAETGLGNDPRMLKAFYKLSTYISEDSFIDGAIEENDVERDITGAPMLKFGKMD